MFPLSLLVKSKEVNYFLVFHKSHKQLSNPELVFVSFGLLGQLLISLIFLVLHPFHLSYLNASVVHLFIVCLLLCACYFWNPQIIIINSE